MKVYKNPIIGVILGIGFMVLGILQIAYPELDGASTPRGVSFAKLIGALLFIAGLVQVLYIVYKRRGDVRARYTPRGSNKKGEIFGSAV